MRQRLKAFVAQRGEPMLGAYSRAEMSALAAAANLAESENTTLIEWSGATSGSSARCRPRRPPSSRWQTIELPGEARW